MLTRRDPQPDPSAVVVPLTDALSRELGLHAPSLLVLLRYLLATQEQSRLLDHPDPSVACAGHASHIVLRLTGRGGITRFATLFGLPQLRRAESGAAGSVAARGTELEEAYALADRHFRQPSPGTALPNAHAQPGAAD
jgi:hypothetical protein